MIEQNGLQLHVVPLFWDVTITRDFGNSLIAALCFFPLWWRINRFDPIFLFSYFQVTQYYMKVSDMECYNAQKNFSSEASASTIQTSPVSRLFTMLWFSQITFHLKWWNFWLLWVTILMLMCRLGAEGVRQVDGMLGVERVSFIAG